MTYYHPDDLVRNNQLKPLSEETLAQINAIKETGMAMFDCFAQFESSRELSLARTKLEEAVMWATKSVTR